MLWRYREVFNIFVLIFLRIFCESVIKFYFLIICLGEFLLIIILSLFNRVGVYFEVCKRMFLLLEFGELLFLGFLNDEL